MTENSDEEYIAPAERQGHPDLPSDACPCPYCILREIEVEAAGREPGDGTDVLRLQGKLLRILILAQKANP